MREVRIAILQRGWVFVGYFSQKGERIRLSKAKCVRRWGTNKGLGQLAAGPKSDTVLDDAGTVEYHQATEVASILCNPEKWHEELG